MNNTFRQTARGLSVLVLLAAASTSLAQPPVIVPPQPLDTSGIDSLGFGTEGLHFVRFSVKADGTTDEIEVTGGFTNPQAAPFVENVVKAWTFTPGTVNGEPANFYNQEYIVRNYLQDVPLITPEVETGLTEASTLAAEGDFDKARKQIERLIERNLVTAFDYAIAHEILVGIYMEQQQYFEALAASRISTTTRINSDGNQEFLLTPELLEAALRKRFILAASLYQAGEAVRTFEIMQGAFELPADDPLQQAATNMQAMLDSPEPLSLLAKIGEDEEQWSYEPSRRIFTVTDIDGRLNDINVRCERGNIDLEYEENVDWTIPDSLGNCSLEFVGREGTQFTVIEFAE